MSGAKWNPPAVLYVEDEENDAFFMERAFAACALKDALRIAPDGEKALAWLRQVEGSGEKPRLVVLDINLPTISGFEVLEWIRHSPAFKDIPVCILSSSDHPKDMARAQELGAEQYQVKPSSPEQLKQFVRELKERWL